MIQFTADALAGLTGACILADGSPSFPGGSIDISGWLDWLLNENANGDGTSPPADTPSGGGTDADIGSSSPGLPTGLVGTQDKLSRQQGKKHSSGPLDPSNGGTGDAQKDFDNLTGGKSQPAPPDKYPAGTQIGENGIILRPGTGDSGPRIDIPENGNKPHETLHYP